MHGHFLDITVESLGVAGVNTLCKSALGWSQSFVLAVVSFGGAGAETAVAAARVDGVSMASDVPALCGYRYAVNWHCDLMDVLSDHGASPRLGLDEAARALGLPGKWNGHGSEVAKQAQAGDFAAIDRYCAGDVLNTFVLYLRWAYFSTRMTATGHRAAVFAVRAGTAG
ncbi:MAG: 3'-5' exonuclease [Streptococcus sp.]|nr:3'-5' exonuclease [Streptococcus sp.]